MRCEARPRSEASRIINTVSEHRKAVTKQVAIFTKLIVSEPIHDRM